MANTLTDSGRQGFLCGSWSWLTGTWVPYMLGSFDTGLVATGQKLSDFASTVFRARGTYLTSLAATRGEAIAASTVVGAVGSAGAATVPYVGLFLEASAGAPASQLTWFVGLIDTASVVPFVPNGGDIALLFDPSTSPASRVFKL